MATCDEEGCQVLTTGKCINQLELNVCPHYQEDDDAAIQIPADDELAPREDPIEETVDVFSGAALSETDVDRITKNAVTRFVILAGMPAAGKTTLLLSLMHLFCVKQAFGDYTFAGSETLLDFEEKGHKSKIDSGNEVEDTSRTPVGLIKFLHLRVANTLENYKLTDLVFTDISGEDFRALKDSAEECEKFTMGKRADHLALFFDMLKLSSMDDRAEAKVAGIALIRSLMEAEILLPHTRIQIVFSRWDLQEKETKQDTNEIIEIIKGEVISKYGNINEISFHEIAARPKGTIYEFGYGIGNLLSTWVQGSILNSPKKTKYETQSFNSTRQYLKF